MREYNKIISLVLLIFLNLFSYAQEKSSSYPIKWTQPRAIKISQYDTQKLLNFEGAQYIGEIKELPYIQKVVPIQPNMEVAQVVIINPIFVSLNASELNLLPSNIQFSNSPRNSMISSFVLFLDIMKLRNFSFASKNCSSLE